MIHDDSCRGPQVEVEATKKKPHTKFQKTQEESYIPLQYLLDISFKFTIFLLFEQ